MNFHTVISLPVDSSIQKAWPCLWRKATHTKQFIPSLKELEIQQISNQSLIRSMKLGQLEVKEHIIKDNQTHTVYFHNIEGSAFKGVIYNSLIYDDKTKQLLLQFGSNAIGKDGMLVPPVEMFIGTLKSTKQIIQQSK